MCVCLIAGANQVGKTSFVAPLGFVSSSHLSFKTPCVYFADDICALKKATQILALSKLQLVNGLLDILIKVVIQQEALLVRLGA